MNGTLSDYWKHGAIVAAAMVGFLLAATTTLAATIEKDGDTATAIRDLQIGSITYDVSFLRTTAPAIYPPGSFDFNNALTAEVAVDAVVAVFNADGSVLGVGEGASNPSEYFFVPYDTFDIEINPPGEGGVRIHFLRVWEGYTGNPDQPGSWVSGDILDATPLLTGATYAKFIVVDTGGSGNSPPVADAGDGPYTGVINTAVSFDGSGSSDPDGTIVEYNWDFGNGQSGSGEKPSFVYSTPGIKNVTLTVTDDGNRSNTDSVYAIIGNDSGQPVADAGGPYRGTVGAAVNFDGSE
jgi:hypothetical protein